MKLKKINDEVFYVNSELATLDSHDLDILEQVASQAERKRSRICTHNDKEDILHEMFIIHYKDTYVRPHFHLKKAESIHVISGDAQLIIFTPEGEITNRIEIGDHRSGKKFYLRIAPQTIHCLIVKSDIFIFHESTTGPFERNETSFPEWAPHDSELNQVTNFLNGLNNLCKN